MLAYSIALSIEMTERLDLNSSIRLILYVDCCDKRCKMWCMTHD
jgi:hypothetical protein